MSGPSSGLAAASSGRAARELECGLCGRRFREDRGQPACAGCPLARACRYVRCPHCGYENPVTPAWMDRGEAGPRRGKRGGLRRLLAGLGVLRGSAAAGSEAAARGGPGTAGTLLDLEPGQRATVAGLAEPASPEGRALASLGVLPGVGVEVVQRYPAWIVRVDHAEIAFDDALAAGVRLNPPVNPV